MLTIDGTKAGFCPLPVTERLMPTKNCEAKLPSTLRGRSTHGAIRKQS